MTIGRTFLLGFILQFCGASSFLHAEAMHEAGAVACAPDRCGKIVLDSTDRAPGAHGLAKLARLDATTTIDIEGYEMLKGLEGVATHEHREWLPILENSQDMRALAGETDALLRDNPHIHGFLIRRHGMYTWGVDIDEATRHVEILEFLLESVGRRQMMEPQY